ncbi:hypothetical protein GCM10027294_44370 [Marinactinospora endophytica]
MTLAGPLVAHPTARIGAKRRGSEKRVGGSCPPGHGRIGEEPPPAGKAGPRPPWGTVPRSRRQPLIPARTCAVFSDGSPGDRAVSAARRDAPRAGRIRPGSPTDAGRPAGHGAQARQNLPEAE